MLYSWILGPPTPQTLPASLSVQPMLEGPEATSFPMKLSVI